MCLVVFATKNWHGQYVFRGIVTFVICCLKGVEYVSGTLICQSVHPQRVGNL